MKIGNPASFSHTPALHLAADNKDEKSSWKKPLLTALGAVGFIGVLFAAYYTLSSPVTPYRDPLSPPTPTKTPTPEPPQDPTSEPTTNPVSNPSLSTPMFIPTWRPSKNQDEYMMNIERIAKDNDSEWEAMHIVERCWERSASPPSDQEKDFIRNSFASRLENRARGGCNSALHSVIVLSMDSPWFGETWRGWKFPISPDAIKSITNDFTSSLPQKARDGNLDAMLYLYKGWSGEKISVGRQGVYTEEVNLSLPSKQEQDSIISSFASNLPQKARDGDSFAMNAIYEVWGKSLREREIFEEELITKLRELIPSSKQDQYSIDNDYRSSRRATAKKNEWVC